MVLRVGVVAKRKFNSPAPGMGMSFFCLQERGSTSVECIQEYIQVLTIHELKEEIGRYN